MDVIPLFFSSLRYLTEIIYPPRCLVCDKAGQKNRDLCLACEKSLPWLKVTCQQCALPLADEISDALICGRCLKKTPHFDYSFSLFRFEKEIAILVHQFKFHHKLAVAKLFGDLLASAAIEKLDKPDCLLPVPLHKKRLRQRGFNQSIEIARSLGKGWDIPIETNLVTRSRETQSQTGLDAKQRNRNIKGAFEFIGNTNHRHVAIIDDVVTTGSTVNELARLLKRNGVEKVSVYSIARAL